MKINIVKKLCATHKITRFIIDKRLKTANAEFVHGKNQITLTRKLIKSLNKKELQAVVLHEIGHKIDSTPTDQQWSSKRHRHASEYRADAFVASQGPFKRALMSALKKLILANGGNLNGSSHTHPSYYQRYRRLFKDSGGL